MLAKLSLSVVKKIHETCINEEILLLIIHTRISYSTLEKVDSLSLICHFSLVSITLYDKYFINNYQLHNYLKNKYVIKKINKKSKMVTTKDPEIL